jgi:hypothetical protein
MPYLRHRCYEGIFKAFWAETAHAGFVPAKERKSKHSTTVSHVQEYFEGLLTGLIEHEPRSDETFTGQEAFTIEPPAHRHRGTTYQS